MTDKQIIIDGVDVSEHKFVLNCRCEKLKAKEQECEELKKESENWESLCKHADKQIEELQAENKKLEKNYFTVIQQRNKAEKALAEIKEIAEERNYYPCSWCINKEILQKISEVTND